MILTKAGVFLLMFLSIFIFSIGVFGIIGCRKSLISLMLSAELMILSVVINFISVSSYSSDISGQIMALFIFGIASAEAVIGLSIFLLYAKTKGSIATSSVSSMSG